MLTLDEFLRRSDGNAKVFRDYRIPTGKELNQKLSIAIPDLHLLERGPNDDFFDAKRAKKQHGSRKAFEDRFLSFLDFLVRLKKEQMDALEIIQLGDMYDLWQARGNTNLIESKYPNILGLLEEALQTIYVIGNHDIDLWKYHEAKGETFKRNWRHFSRNPQNEITTVYEHGFQADFANNQDSWSGVIGREVTKVVGMMEYIEPDIDVILGRAWDSVSRIFSTYNAGLTPRKDPDRFITHEYINFYVSLIDKYRRGDTDDHRRLPELTLVVIGHTHSPRLITRPVDGQTCYLMDCGSWVNGGHEFGVIAGNEIAICQWD
jgi:UDP-2,3-diacylglucosamine pyrophosphatase LpxH